MASEKTAGEDAQGSNRRRPYRAVEDCDRGGRSQVALQPSEMAAFSVRHCFKGSGIMKAVICFALLGVLSFPARSAPEVRKGFQWEALRYLAIQDRGRLKPLDTFAKESVLFVTGKTSWNGIQPAEVIFGWLMGFEKEWESEPFIRIDHEPLKRRLGLDEHRRYFSPKELESNEELPKFLREVMKKEKRRTGLDEIEKKGVQLQNQRGLVDAIAGGQALTLLPNPGGLDKPWYSLSALAEGRQPPYSSADVQKLGNAMGSLMQAFTSRDSSKWNEGMGVLASVIKVDLAKGAYPTEGTLGREVHYNELHPFRWAWVCYLIAFILLTVAIVGNGAWFRRIGFTVLLGALACTRMASRSVALSLDALRSPTCLNR